MLSTIDRASVLAGIGSNYDISRCISETGMSRVFKAWDYARDRWVIIKSAVARSKACSTADPIQFLRREVIALTRLRNHPGIACLLKSSFVNGTFFVVLEYIEGSSLRELISSTFPSVEECVGIVKKILTVLSSIHSQGLWHFDLKPENIIITDSREVKIIDFGLARFVSVGRGMNQLVSSDGNFVFGTPGSVSPEQAIGSKYLDQRCDIYCLGIILHELLTGVSPFTEVNGVPFWRHPYFNPFSGMHAVSIPRNIQEVVLKALALNPNARYQSADEMLCALQKVV